MANYCTNQLIVRGSDEALERFKAAVSGPERPDFIVSERAAHHILEQLSGHAKLALTEAAEQHRRELLAEAGLPDDALSLDRMIAHLAQKEMTTKAAQALDQEETTILVNFHRILPVPLPHLINEPEEWNWLVNLWGTHGMPGDNDVSLSESPGQLEYVFDTRWSPAYGIAHKLIEMFPELDIAFLYVELGNNFCGAIWSIGAGDYEDVEYSDALGFMKDDENEEPTDAEEEPAAADGEEEVNEDDDYDIPGYSDVLQKLYRRHVAPAHA